MKENNALRAYTNIKNMSMSMPESAIYTVDVEEIIQSHLLNGQTRKVMALLYGLELTVRESSIVSLLTVKEIMDEEEEFEEVYEAINNGYPSRTLEYERAIEEACSLEEWLQQVENLQSNPLLPPQRVRIEVASILSRYDQLAEEMIYQIENPQRREEIMDNTSDNEYPDHDTSPLIEGPNRNYEYVNRLRSGGDYFREQDLRNGTMSIEDDLYGYLQ